MKTPKILKDFNQESICYLESALNYTLFILQDGRSVVSGYNIKVFETLFEDQAFVKINRSKLVNVSFIQKACFVKNTCSILLFNGQEMNVSRRRLNKLKADHPTIF
jgi:two-component system, LytTR family, response regulator